MTISLTPALTIIPFVPDTSTEATCPPPPSMVSALVIVTSPNPAGSSASISPPGAVFEIAPAKVLQGAVLEHGLASSPTPETHVRVACAKAVDVIKTNASTEIKRTILIVIKFPLYLSGIPECRVLGSRIIRPSIRKSMNLLHCTNGKRYSILPFRRVSNAA